MSCDRPENQLNKHDDSLPVAENTSPACVPVFNCIVYVRYEDGSVSAKVANLAGLSCTAANERDALGKIIPLFKTMLKEFTDGEMDVPWIDPGPDPESAEQVRFIPVHL